MLFCVVLYAEQEIKGGKTMAVQYAYIRVSTTEQNEARQIEAVKKHNSTIKGHIRI